MPRTRNSKSRRSVVTFLGKVPLVDLDWLERIGPELTYILRHLYSPVPCTVAALAAAGPWTAHVINARRDQALYLLGSRRRIAARHKRAADNRLAEFELRQRLAYLRDHAKLGPGDREIVNLALQHGACADEIARQSTWSLQTVRHALGRLCGVKSLAVIRPGARVRTAAFGELLRTKDNPKAELELRALTTLGEGRSPAEVAEALGIVPTALSAVTDEARRELAAHRATASAFAELDRQRADPRRPDRVPGPNQMSWLNARLLPLYRRFRGQATPFSARERRYLTARSEGCSIAQAGRSALAVPYWRATILDRIWLRELPHVEFSFPAVLPLAPFTKAQEELMEQICYARL